jgi:glycine/D-amino acid oxidase-like deaminating enzyme
MLKQEYEREKEFVPAIRFLDADETAAASGLLDRSSVFGAIFQPQAQQVPTTRMMTALERLIRGVGVDVRLGMSAQRIVSAKGSVVGVETSAGMVRADAVINAAGAFAHQLGKQSGVSVGAVPLLESRFVTDPLDGATRGMPMMLFFERDLLYVREEQGGLLVGAIEQHLRDASCPSLENPPDVSALPANANEEHEELARRCADIIPALARMTVRDRANGLPTWTPDGRHVLGCAPGLEGYVVLAGCNECGVTHGPGLARIASALALEGRTGADIAPYRVGRFARLSEQEMIEGAVAQYLARHPAKPGQAATPFGITLPTS